MRKQLFREAVEEDIAGLTNTDIDLLVEKAREFLDAKAPGRVKIRITDSGVSEGALAQRSILEILNDDMPFLVDSVINALSTKGHTVRTVLHPVFASERDGKGKLKTLDNSNKQSGDFLRESYLHIHLEAMNSKREQDELVAELRDILDEIRAAVVDWQPMQHVIQGRIDQLRTKASPLPTAIVSETIDFLSWLLNNKFTFLGMCHYKLGKKGGKKQMLVDEKSALGVLRLQRGQVIQNAAKRNLSGYKSGYAIVVEKSDLVSRVHRSAVMDYVGLYDFDQAGNVVGELRVVGLFASTAYTEAASGIPLLRRRIEAVMALSGFTPSGHSGKGLLNILETMSRDDLFQIESEQLAPLAMGMWRLHERPRTRVFLRLDRFERYAIAFVFFPRDRFSSDLREKAGAILEKHYQGKTLEFMPNFGEGTLVRVRFIISLGVSAKNLPDPDLVEKEIVEATRSWGDELADAVTASTDGSAGRTLARRYANAFPPAYREANRITEAQHDIAIMEGLSGETRTAAEFAPPVGSHGAVWLKLFNLASPVPLSARLPLLEDMGLRALDENTYIVQPSGKPGSEADAVYIHEVALSRDNDAAIDEQCYQQLQDCFLAVWTGKADSDPLNGLVLSASLSWQEVTVLRAFARYLRQTGFPFALSVIAGTLVRYGDVTRLLVDLFKARFQPGHPKADTLADREKLQTRLLQKIEDHLADVPSLDDDRIIRHMVGVITATQRTNFFNLKNLQGGLPIALAMKIHSKDVPGIPAPVPFAEIFVHSTLVEGVHLRGGMIARGGLRWSDRAEDFRTEVLGLAKAQNVKNAVIVPVGAKGGFIPRQLPAGGSRDEVYQAGTLAYQSFISSLLSLTDNTKGGKIIPPPKMVRQDGDDPYLVVAADKGTAAFSDVANAISSEAGFWLDDAFASGGSAGYDHKKMGITARGGWEAVKRHFRELDRDIQTTPFTAVGVGDMSGDVFGNGMLLSEQTKLLAAFDHRDIFIDPDPDVATSFAERKRLFELPRSSWQDYERKLISKGGGIFSRSEKQISLSPEIMAVTGLTASKVTPNELMRAIIKCDADLLWFGGIGTYVRGATESDADAGDKANDSIRVMARELKVKAVGEGANLGMTQLARVEFALNGGRINTDAIDNSAGVNSSDVEVNLKIALGEAEAAGKLKRAARNKLLAAMTDDVADLVLRNNYLQTLCVTLMEEALSRDRAGLSRLFRELENRGGLDRAIEFLPFGEELDDRLKSGGSLSRPEMAVLVSYAKIVVFNDLMAQQFASDPYLENELMRYFPNRMSKTYKSEISGHRLRPEIISTLIANSIVNRCGPLFLFDLSNDTGIQAGDLARFYVASRDSFGFVDMNEAVDRLDNRIS
ncbi:MAG: NAD-glutamate dehydrogenase, partial [Anderseniella sp.]